MSRTKTIQDKTQSSRPRLKLINPNSAGIDVGANEVYVAVPLSLAEKNIRRFGSTTPDLQEMAIWLSGLGITSVAMESTGVYWMPPFSVLESHGLEVHLVDARKLHTAPGRKTDVCDAQWLQELHSFGLLSRVVILPEENRRLRSLLRLRENHTRAQGQAIQRMQKAMTEMNVRLDRVLTDISGKTGMDIIRAIIAGETEPEQLVKFRHKRCKHSPEEFVKALTGYYTPEHLFALRHHLAVFDFYEGLIEDCEAQMETLISSMQSSPNGHSGEECPFSEFHPVDTSTAELTHKTAREKRLHEIFGVNLTKVPGVGEHTALVLLAEVGSDLSRWPSYKAFCSWLGLCPHPKISGGKILSTKSKRSSNRAAQALRMAASGLYRSDCYIGAFHQRMRYRKEKASAVTATAHKLARAIWICVTKKVEFREQGSEFFEQQRREKKLKKFLRLGQELGLSVPAA